MLIQKALNTGPLIYPALQMDRQVLSILLKKWDLERLSNLEDLPEGTQLDEWLQTKRLAANPRLCPGWQELWSSEL